VPENSYLKTRQSVGKVFGGIFKYPYFSTYILKTCVVLIRHSSPTFCHDHHGTASL